MKKIKLTKKFKSKPSYDLYIQLWYTLDIYLSRINEYIFFEYYKWDVPEIKLVNKLSINDINKLKKIYEYDYEVFKVLLFLYWDLECYLEDTDKVKDTLKVDLKDNELLNLMYKNKVISNMEYWNKISLRKPINLWTNLDMLGMFKKILKYDLYFNIYSLGIKYNNKNASNKKSYKLYKKYNDLLRYEDIYVLRLIQADTINSSYFESYIESWYKEWYSEINIDLTSKYKSKIKHLDLEFKQLVEFLQQHSDT